MLPVNFGMGPALAPPAPGGFAPGFPLAGQLRGIGSTGRTFAPVSGGFQLGGGASPASQAMQTAVQEAHADMVVHASQCMAAASAQAAAPAGGLRLIDGAQARAMDAIFRHAADPSQAEEIYAAGRYAARMGVEDLAVALSELREHGGAAQECDRLEKSLCEMLVKDGLGDRSGFSAWHDGNCYDQVSQLTATINARLDALPDKPDIFEAAMRREVMPAIRQYLETRFGHLSYATWQKIDAAGGLISRAAAEAADRMTESLRNLDQGTGALRAKVNQWRVAQHWAELMRGASAEPAATPQPASPPVPETAGTPGPTPAATRQAGAAEATPYSVRQESNPVFKPIFVIGARDVDGTLNRILEERDSEEATSGTAEQPTPAAARRPSGQGAGSPATRPPVSRDEPVVAPPAQHLQAHEDPGANAGRSGVTSTPEDTPDGGPDTAGAARRLPDGNPVLQLRPSVQAMRIAIPVPPPLPQSGSTPPSPVAAAMTSPPSPSTSPASPASETSATSSLEETGTDQAVTLRDARDRSLSPVQQLIRKFEDAGIGAQPPVKGAEHIGSLLHSVGNRISTTEWPLLRSVSTGDAGPRGSGAAGSRGSLDSLASSSEAADEASPSVERALSPSSRPDYARLASGGAATSPFQRLSTAGRAIQVGPAFSNVGERA